MYLVDKLLRLLLCERRNDGLEMTGHLIDGPLRYVCEVDL